MAKKKVAAAKKVEKKGPVAKMAAAVVETVTHPIVSIEKAVDAVLPGAKKRRERRRAAVKKAVAKVTAAVAPKPAKKSAKKKAAKKKPAKK